ncbi:MAG: FmdB family zinc ribbon protein [Steroidobacteraceae bacterium]
MPPIYAYACPGCGQESEEIRCIAMRDARLACGRCEQPMTRVISAAVGIVKDPAVEKKVRNKSKHTSFPSAKRR